MEKEKFSSFRFSPSKFVSIKSWDRKTYQKNALTAFLGGYVASISGITILGYIGDTLMLIGVILEIVWIYKTIKEKKEVSTLKQ